MHGRDGEPAKLVSQVTNSVTSNFKQLGMARTDLFLREEKRPAFRVIHVSVIFKNNYDMYTDEETILPWKCNSTQFCVI